MFIQSRAIVLFLVFNNIISLEFNFSFVFETSWRSMCHKVLTQVKTTSIVKKPSSGNFVTAKSGEQQIKGVSILQARFFTEHILLYHSFSGSRKWGGIYLSFSWTFSWHSTCHVHKVRSSISVTLKFVFKRLIDGAGKSFVHQLGLHAISFFHLFSWSIHSYYMLPFSTLIICYLWSVTYSSWI